MAFFTAKLRTEKRVSSVLPCHRNGYESVPFPAGISEELRLT